MTLPANVNLFTNGTVAIYPSINTSQCLDRLSGFFSSPDISRQYGIKPKALLEAIELVMYNNCMCFGNVLVKKISGIQWECIQLPHWPTSLWPYAKTSISCPSSQPW